VLSSHNVKEIILSKPIKIVEPPKYIEQLLQCSSSWPRTPDQLPKQGMTSMFLRSKNSHSRNWFKVEHLLYQRGDMYKIKQWNSTPNLLS
jgi:hypothetical protein